RAGGRVVRVALEVSAQFENFLPLQRASRQFVEAVQDAEAHRDAAAKTAGGRNLPGNRTGKRKRPGLCSLEKGRGGGAGHGIDRPAAPARNGHVIVETEGDAEAVETGSEIGCARRD